jgi:transcriptional regulator with XRE-family HTH domain
MSPQKAVPIRIREFRERHGWSQADLTKRLNQLGAGLDRSQVARVEAFERGIPVDELVLFALALNTSLVSLLFPPESDAAVDLTPKVSPPVRDRAAREREREAGVQPGQVRIEATAKEARAWARGQLPLWPFQDARSYVEAEPRDD